MGTQVSQPGTASHHAVTAVPSSRLPKISSTAAEDHAGGRG